MCRFPKMVRPRHSKVNICIYTHVLGGVDSLENGFYALERESTHLGPRAWVP